jgi:Kelch motif/Galactose oxidase, central domain
VTSVLRSLLGKIPLALLLLTALVVPIALGSSEEEWTPVRESPMPERQEVSYVALGGKLYLTAGNQLDQDRYDPATDTWSAVQSLPATFTEVDHVHGVAVGGKIAYIGGITKFKLPFPVKDTVSLYDPATNSFTPGTAMPEARGAGGVTTWRGLVIYAGGLNETGSVTRVDAYDPVTGDWTQLKNMPRARDHFQAVVVDDVLYAIGGRVTKETAGGGEEIDDIATVDKLVLPDAVVGLKDAEWTADVTSLPTLRGGHGVAAVGECIYVIGGEGDAVGPAGVTGVTESYDTATGEWDVLLPLLVPRHGIQAAVIGQRIYVAAGGTEQEDYVPTEAHEILDVRAKTPCVAGAPEPDPEPEPEPEPENPTPPGDKEQPPVPPVTGGPTPTPTTPFVDVGEALRVERLSVKPRRVRAGGKASIVVVLSQRGKVLLRVAKGFRLTKSLPAGRSVVPLPTRFRGRPPAPGRYQLVAQAQGAGAEQGLVRASFVVVD